MISLLRSVVLTFPPIYIAFLIISGWDASLRVSSRQGLLLFLFGTLFFVNATSLLNKLQLQTALGHKFRRKFNLKLSGCLDISNKLVSAIQALLSVIFGAVVCRYSCSRNFLTTSHIFTESYAWFASSYFLYDIFSMYKVYCAKLYDKFNMKPLNMQKTDHDFYSMIPTFQMNELSWFKSIKLGDEKIPSFWEYIKNSKLMVFHHMFIGSYGLLVITSWRGKLGDCVFSLFYLMEISTPCVNFRSILVTMNLKDTRLYIVNGLLMLLLFTVFRIIMIPSLMYYYSRLVNMSFVGALSNLPITCKFSIASLFLPQLYWYFLMIRGAIKMVKVQSTKITKHKDINENNHHVTTKAD